MSSGVHPWISLIVPVWGDDELAASLVESMPLDPVVGEWVIAAVSPSERLKRLHQCGAIRLVVCEEPSRGRQSNLGAAQARGALLCFHHADSVLLPAHLSALVAVARNEKIAGGAFHRKFDDRHRWMKRAESLARRISERVGPLFGDQSIFVRAGDFSKLGGFADIPLMEDVEFSRRLRRLGRIVLLDPPLWSSPRRFQRIGSWRTTAMNAGFIVLFYLGVSPFKLHRWYYREKAASRSSGLRSAPLPKNAFVE
jgi:hypothetical protein